MAKESKNLPELTPDQEAAQMQAELIAKDLADADTLPEKNVRSLLKFYIRECEKTYKARDAARAEVAALKEAQAAYDAGAALGDKIADDLLREMPPRISEAVEAAWVWEEDSFLVEIPVSESRDWICVLGPSEISAWRAQLKLPCGAEIYGEDVANLEDGVSALREALQDFGDIFRFLVGEPS